MADNRNVETPANNLSDVLERNSFFSDSMVTGSCNVIFPSDPVNNSRIQPMDGGPALKALTQIGGYTLFPRQADQHRNEGMITVAVNRWR